MIQSTPSYVVTAYAASRSENPSDSDEYLDEVVIEWTDASGTSWMAWCSPESMVVECVDDGSVAFHPTLDEAGTAWLRSISAMELAAYGL